MESKSQIKQSELKSTQQCTEERENHIETAKQRLQELGLLKERHTKEWIGRFLEAKKYKLEAAIEMLVDCEKWRDEYRVDELMDYKLDNLKEVKEIYPQYYHFHCKEYRPLYIEILGKLSYKEIMKYTNEEDLIRYQVAEFERLVQHKFPICSRLANRPIQTAISITDLKKASLSSFPRALSFIKKSILISQQYYPGTMGLRIIINAGFMFQTIWKILKPMMRPEAIERTVILGSEYMEYLEKIVDRKFLPKSIGGDCECTDCCMEENGPWKTDETVEIEKVKSEKVESEKVEIEVVESEMVETKIEQISTENAFIESTAKLSEREISTKE